MLTTIQPELIPVFRKREVKQKRKGCKVVDASGEPASFDVVPYLFDDSTNKNQLGLTDKINRLDLGDSLEAKRMLVAASPRVIYISSGEDLYFYFRDPKSTDRLSYYIDPKLRFVTNVNKLDYVCGIKTARAYVTRRMDLSETDFRSALESGSLGFYVRDKDQTLEDATTLRFFLLADLHRLSARSH